MLILIAHHSYIYGQRKHHIIAARFQPNIADNVLREAPFLAETLLDGLIWRSHKSQERGWEAPKSARKTRVFFLGGGFASRNNGLTMFNQYKAWMKTSDSADVSDLGDWSNIQFLSGNLTRSNQHRDLIWVWNNLSGDLTNMFCIFFQWKWWFVEHLGGFHHQKMGETKVDKYIDWTPHQDYIWVCGT